MRFYTKAHTHYCGVDLHARTLYLCILGQDGVVLLHRSLPCDPDRFLHAIAPFREDLVVAVECMFAWYWLADLCAREGIPFVLGHALYMKAIHGGKAKNDRIDAAEDRRPAPRRAFFPQAYVYPAEMRETRDLLRRRLSLRPPAGRAPRPHPEHPPASTTSPASASASPTPRTARASAKASPTRACGNSIAADLALIDHYDAIIGELELARPPPAPSIHDPNAFALLALGPRHRQGPRPDHPLRDPRHRPLPVACSDFASYCRLVKCDEKLGRQEPRHRREQDRQRPPEVGLLRGGRPLRAAQRGGQAVARRLQWKHGKAKDSRSWPPRSAAV